MSEEATRIIHAVFNGHRNFMTPTIIRYEMVGEYAVEVSSGRFIDHTIYGVTMVHRVDGHDSTLSEAFDSLAEVDDYLDSFRAKAD